MAELGNKISITLSAFDMMNMLASIEGIFMFTGHPTPEIEASFDNFKAQIFENCSEESMNEALAEMKVNNLMNEMRKKP